MAAKLRSVSQYLIPCLVITSITTPSRGQTPYPIEIIGGSSFEPTGVSADGQTIVGIVHEYNTPTLQHAARWSGGSLTTLPSPSSCWGPTCSGVSADGAVAVGSYTLLTQNPCEDFSNCEEFTCGSGAPGYCHQGRPVVWGPHGIDLSEPLTVPYQYYTWLHCVSGDGSTYGGAMWYETPCGSGEEVFRGLIWSGEGLYLDPVTLPNFSEVIALSHDGRVAAGQTNFQPSIWIDGVRQVLGFSGESLAVSGMGQVVTGYASTGPSTGIGFRWDLSSGEVTYDSAVPRWQSVSEDGERMVGGQHLWTAEGGTRLLTEYLIEGGYSEVVGWTIHPKLISADGSMVVGFADSPSGVRYAVRIPLCSDATNATTLGNDFDLSINHVEFTQAVQDSQFIAPLRGLLPLVYNKPIIVRAYVRVDGHPPVGCTGWHAVLRAYAADVAEPVGVWLDENGPLITPDANESNWHNQHIADNEDGTLNFKVQIPEALAQTIVSWEVEVNPCPLAVPAPLRRQTNVRVLEADYTNNIVTTDRVRFESRCPLAVLGVLIRHQGVLPAAQETLPGVADRMYWSMYPVPRGSYRVLLLPIDFDFNLASYPVAVWNRWKLKSQLESFRQQYNAANPEAMVDRIAGWLPENAMGSDGYLIGSDGEASSSTFLIEASTLGRNASTFAHELGHTMRSICSVWTLLGFSCGHRSTPTSSTGVDVHAQPKSSTICGNIQDGRDRIFPAGSAPLMGIGTDCDQWIDAEEYSALLGDSELMCSGGPERGSEVVAALVLAAHTDGLTTAIDYLHELPQPSHEIGPWNEAGELTVRTFVHDPERRQVLAERFSQLRLSDDPALSSYVLTIPATESSTGLHVDELEISDSASGQVLFARSRSAHAPNVAFTTPAVGSVHAEEFSVEWVADDLDNDALTFIILYSWNDGTSWLPLAVDQAGSSFLVAPASLPGSGQGTGRLRVRASDGFNSSSAELTGLTVGMRKPPVVYPESPLDQENARSGVPLYGRALAIDPEDGELPDSSITWTSSLDGLVGQGAEPTLSGLSIGTHVLTVEAVDSDGMIGSDSVTLEIVEPQDECGRWNLRTPGGPAWAAWPSTLAFDELRSVVVALDANTGHTWEWDGSEWMEHATPGPGPFSAPLLVWDGTTETTLCIGAANDGMETWSWDGASWELLPVNGPTPRALAMAAYDEARRAVVLYGGLAADLSGLGDTWAWDGASWAQVATTGPSPRFLGTMAYDVRHRVIVLFGGGTFSGLAAPSLWEWDGTQWTERSEGGGPPADWSGGVATAYDRTHELVIVAQGTTASVWEWDGVSWAARYTHSEPAPQGIAAAYDSARQIVANLATDGGMWEYDSDGIRINSNPQDTRVLFRGTTLLSVGVEDPEDKLYHWRHSGIRIVDSAVFHGARTSTLAISNVNEEATGAYDVMISTPCGLVTSRRANLVVCPRSDLDPDGVVGLGDLAGFVECMAGPGSTTSACSPEVHATRDLDDDLDVDLLDFASLQRQFGIVCP